MALSTSCQQHADLQLRGCRQAVVPMPVFGSGRPISSSTVVKPGPAWRAALLTPDNLEWLSGLLAQLRGRPDLPLAASARQLLVFGPHPGACCLASWNDV